MEKIVQWEQENPASNGRGLIDDFSLWGARRWSRTNTPPKKPRWRTGVARDFNHPNAFLSEGGVLPVVVESFPVASCAIEASVVGEGEGSGGGDGGARGALPPVGGSKGPEPLASPNVLHWVGWLPGTRGCLHSWKTLTSFALELSFCWCFLPLDLWHRCFLTRRGRSNRRRSLHSKFLKDFHEKIDLFLKGFVMVWWR